MAVAEALRIGSILAAEVEVLHVVRGPEADLAEARSEARAWMEAAGLRADDLGVRAGIPWIELARRARELAAGLVVVGSHGRSGYRPMTLGGTASGLALAAPCAVVIVNPRISRPPEPESVVAGAARVQPR